MASARLVAFLRSLDAGMPQQKQRAEALILRVPGEGHPALRADEEADVLVHVAEGIIPRVQGWVRAVKDLADAERAWGPQEHAAQAGLRFAAATQQFLDVWEKLLQVQPATEPMRHVLLLMHQGCYEFFLSGPLDLWRTCTEISEGKHEARLTFEPSAPSLNDASQELRRLRSPR